MFEAARLLDRISAPANQGPNAFPVDDTLHFDHGVRARVTKHVALYLHTEAAI
ncbi:hypothetical protein SERLADRAFT_402694, partial [Serpula lacrymans var. lacrymans S7.9]